MNNHGIRNFSLTPNELKTEKTECIIKPNKEEEAKKALRQSLQNSVQKNSKLSVPKNLDMEKY
jgi:hypothetical protein